MVDMQDPEVIESLKYLLVPKEEKMRTQARPFDGKKNCWIPEHKEGFIAAEIQSTKGEEITVKTSKGEVIYRKNQLFKKKQKGNRIFLNLDCYCQKR